MRKSHQKGFESIFPDRETSQKAIGVIQGLGIELKLDLVVGPDYQKLMMTPYYFIPPDGAYPQVLFSQVQQVVSVSPSARGQPDEAGTCFQLDQRNENLPRRINYRSINHNINWMLSWIDRLSENYVSRDYSYAMMKSLSGRIYFGPLNRIVIPFEFRGDVYYLGTFLFYYRSSADNWKFFGFDLSSWSKHSAKNTANLCLEGV